MAENEVPLTASEQELLGQMARFAERRAANGVYFNRSISRSLGCSVVFFVALGEQADALERVVMGAQEQKKAVEVFSMEDLTEINKLDAKR